MYLTIFWPCIFYTVHKLSQYTMQPSRPVHLQAIQAFIICCNIWRSTRSRVVFSSKFLYASKSNSICRSRLGQPLGYLTLHAGSCHFLGDAPVSWKSKKQSTVSKSLQRLNSEYHSWSSTVSEIIWQQHLLHVFEVLASSTNQQFS